MSNCSIVSVHFAAVEADRSAFGFGFYRIPAVPVGAEPAVLAVADKVQVEEGPYEYGQNGKRPKRKYPCAGEVIARDLVQHWTENGIDMRPGCHPGIFLVRDRLPLLHENGMPEVDAEGVPQWRPATPEERSSMYAEDLANARIADRAYASALFLKANALAEDPRQIRFIPKTAKLAAKHYGLEADWLKENAATDVKACPMCTKIIARRAILCPHCHGIADLDGYAQAETLKNAALKNARQQPQPVA